MRSRILRRLTAAIAAVVAVPAALTGCFATPAVDSSFEERIPAALEAADLGLSDVWASRSTDGLTVVLNVGGTSSREEVSPDDLREMLQIIRSNNTLGGSKLDFSLRNADDSAFVDLDGPAQSLGAPARVSASDGPLGIVLSWDDVDRIVG
jgi:hypothetical protein